ncbi:hypothetical protein DITRI_Ditri16bG0097700 [Diplodiscus trichospermus]
MLHDQDGTVVWNTNTAGKFVSRLNLTEGGNLVLYGRNNEKVWQSFDHPTDALVPGQALVSGQKLTAQLSTSNSSAGLYSLAVMNDSLIAFLEPDAQQVYFGPLKFIQLGSDGHLRAYQLRESKWEQVSDLLISYTGACGFPLMCGEYGICSFGKCGCPTYYFNQVSENNPDLGCAVYLPLSCKPSDFPYHDLLELKDIDYFSFVPHIENATRNKCQGSLFEELFMQSCCTSTANKFFCWRLFSSV